MPNATDSSEYQIEKLRELFLKYGECNHPKQFFKESKIAGRIITDCGVCGKRMNMVYSL